MTAAAVFESSGFCPCCRKPAVFRSENAWLRDHFRCLICNSIPRERALMRLLDQHFPEWNGLVIHESSPAAAASSVRLARECKRYVPSQLFADREPGSIVSGVRCENLEALSFRDESIDLHVTQDVMEHVFDPHAAFAEIARTLRPGGAHLFTAPLVNKEKPSQRAATLNADGSITHHFPPEYHGNPIDPRGSLVTWRWGFDIARHIFEASGLFTEIYVIDDLTQGIRAEYIEVLLSRKVEATADGTAP